MRTLWPVSLLATASVWAGPKTKREAKPPVATAVVKPAEKAPPFIGVLPTQSPVAEFEALLSRADETLKRELGKYTLEYAPDGTNDEAAAAHVKGKNQEALQVRLTLHSEGAGLKAMLVVTKWPAGGMKGSWFIKADGPPPAELIDAAVPQCVDDAAADLGWQKKPSEAPAP